MLILAHPLADAGLLLLPPITVATVVASVVAFAAASRTQTTPTSPQVTPHRSLERDLDSLDIGGRLVGVGLLALTVLAGRFGPDSEFTNLASVLVVAFAWPMLVLGSALLPTLWPRLNPWDGLARVLGARDGEFDGDVRWAVVAGFGWVAYLGILGRPLAPQSVTVVLALYSIATIAACMVVGRIRWLASGEVFTVFFGWIGLRGGLIEWQPPRGASALLGVLGGGSVFGALRVGDLWAPLALSTTWSWVGLIAACSSGAILLSACERRADQAGSPGAVVAAAVPAVAALAFAAAMARNRLFVSAQLLPSALTDPFGTGLDPLGIGTPQIEPEPLGLTGLLIVQLLVLLAGHVAGALIGRRRATRAARGALILALTILGAAGALALTAV